MNPPTPPLPNHAPTQARKSLAVASLILGILAVVLSLFVIGGALGVVGLILGVVHLRQRRGPGGMAWWGASLSVLGIFASICTGIAYFQIAKHVQETMKTAGGETSALGNWEGVMAPDIAVTTLDGRKLSLRELRGKRVVLDFWATWCPPCVKEIPHFIQLHKDTSRDDLEIVGISSEEESALKPFVKKHGVNYPIASADNLGPPFNAIQSIPTTIFIDRKGIIQSIMVGYHDLETLRTHALAKDFTGEPKLAPTSGQQPPEKAPQNEKR